MSEKIFHVRKKLTFASSLFAFLLFGYFFVTANQISAHTNVQISKVEQFAFFGNYQSVTVKLAESTNPDGYRNFSFLIQYDTTYLSYHSAQPDSLFIACGWETFTVTSIAPGLIHIDAEAGIAATSHFANQNGALCRITFKVTNNITYAYHSTYVQFYWQDCFDNRLESLNEDSLFVVDTARLHPFLLPPLPTPATLPSIAGIPDSCASLEYNGKPLSRSVTFIAGTVEMQSDLLMPRGDVNLNGIINEPEDRDVLVKEFLYISIWPWPDPNMVAQTDVNWDGIAMSVLDLIFLHRLVLADTVPVLRNEPDTSLASPEYAPDTAFFYHDVAQKTFTLSYPERLLDVFMFTSLPAAASLSAIHFSQPAVVRLDTISTGSSRGFIFADNISGFTSGEFLTYTGASNLVSLGTASDFHHRLVVVKTITTSMCGDFNATGSITVGDLVYMVGFLFNNGAMPQDVGSGDINCSGTTTIADLVRLVAYLFNSGPTPCCLAN